MAKNKKASKKAARRHIEQKLKFAFATLETVLGNKDFRQNIKKAGKALTDGLKNKRSQQAFEGLRKIRLKKANSGHARSNGSNISSETISPRKRETVQISDEK